MLCLVYAIATSTGLTIVTALVEYALPRRASRRWLWCLVIAVSVGLPLLTMFYHEAPAIVVGTRTVLKLAFDGTLDLAFGTWGSWLTSGAFYYRAVVPAWLITSMVLFGWGLANAYSLRRTIQSSSIPQGDENGESLGYRAPVTITESVGWFMARSGQSKVSRVEPAQAIDSRCWEELCVGDVK